MNDLGTLFVNERPFRVQKMYLLGGKFWFEATVLAEKSFSIHHGDPMVLFGPDGLQVTKLRLILPNGSEHVRSGGRMTIIQPWATTFDNPETGGWR